MYMSYCRFEGTRAELMACLGEVEEHLDGTAEYEISAREIDCFQSMVENFFVFLQESGIVDWGVEMDKDALAYVCDLMAQKGEE